MGYGVIAVDESLFAQLVNAPSDSHLDSPSLEQTPLDTVAAAFKLPRQYTIIGVGRDYSRRIYLIGVVSDDLPYTPVGAMPPTVMPMYQQTLIEDPDGTVRKVISVSRMDIFTPSPDPWPALS